MIDKRQDAAAVCSPLFCCVAFAAKRQALCSIHRPAASYCRCARDRQSVSVSNRDKVYIRNGSYYMINVKITEIQKNKKKKDEKIKRARGEYTAVS